MSRHAETMLPGQPLQIADREFAAIRDLVYRNFGINLTEQKRTLVVGRLQKVLRERGLNSFREYLEFLAADRSGQALEELANRISTNHTFFYRENQHFELFQHQVLEETVRRHEARREHDLRIWCAGCSSGEEPYTLVMLMMEYFGARYSQWQAGLLATDISAQALQTAMAGVYEGERLEKMPAVLKNKYFRRLPDGRMSVVDAVRREITFRRHNLMNKNFSFRKPFDAIFCRNVMIYFDRPTRQELVAKFHRHTAPGGYLFIGHSESLGRGESPYEYVQPAVYRKAVADE